MQGTLHGLVQKVYVGVVEGVEADADWLAKPTLTNLAERFGVSLSPVRSAVDRLVEDGYLERTATGRLHVATSPPLTRVAQPQSDSSPAEIDVCARLRVEMIRRGVRGDEGFVREQPLADRFGVGRTALRSVMNKLAIEGLVELEPRRGWRTRKFDKNDLCSFLEVREMLESRALELARPGLQTERLEAFLAENEAPDLNPHAPLSNELHDYWIELSDNRYIADFFSRDAVYYRTIFDYATPEAEAVAEMAEQHCEILKALLAKQWSRADKALRRHILAQKPIVKAVVEKVNDL